MLLLALNELGPRKGQGTIDVHGLRPGEAIDRVERALSQAIEDGLSTLKVIVGKGLHSAGGQPVLKGVVKQGLERYDSSCSSFQKEELIRGVYVCGTGKRWNVKWTRKMAGCYW